MNLKKFVLFLLLLLSTAPFCYSQIKPTISAAKTVTNQAKASPAYAELLLRRTEREAQLEEFLLDYTDEFPKIKEIKFELTVLQKQMDKVSSVSIADAPKLSLALGKLLVRETELEVELWNLLKQYNADHPEVKRAKRKIEVYDQAVKEILP